MYYSGNKDSTTPPIKTTDLGEPACSGGALAIKKAHYGETHWEVATALNVFANTYVCLHDVGNAKSTLCEALEIFRKKLGDAHPHTIRVLDSFNALQ